jgi:hypothetical protein
MPRCKRRRVSVAKKLSTALAQEQEVGVKWNTHLGCRASQHFGMLVDGVVVEDGMDQLASGDSGLNPIEEAGEFLMAMTRHTLADDGAVEDIERREQRRRAVADVIVGHRPGRPFFIGKPGWVRSRA